MNILQAVVFGIVQGVTEWLPVSSSGHLVILQKLFGLEQVVSFDIALHLATTLVVILVFWREIVNIKRRFLLYLIIGSIPIGIVGYFFYDFITSLFESLFAVGLALIFTGLILLLSKLGRERKKLGLKDSLLVGIVQALALVPGVSRSGMTVSSSLLFGLKKEEAIRFSFLLYLPAAFGATIFELTKVKVTSSELFPFLIGMVTCLIVGYFALGWLIKIIRKEKFYLFGFYCLVLGIVLLLLI